MNGNTRRIAPAAWLVAVAIAAGCGDEAQLLIPNEAPNTRISAGPPEATDTGYAVNLFWFGWDDDGFVDHYEIAWETPENWLGPIFSNDSLFSVVSAESCCVTPLPDFGPVSGLMDSVYEQFHTFYVRAVDDNGVPDPTPAVRSFNAKTLAPFTEINFGPLSGRLWGPSVQFDWTGTDEDGVVVGYERALMTSEQNFWDTGKPFKTPEFIAWLDTLSYYPVGPGQRKDSLPWEFTDVDSVVFPGLSEINSQGTRQLYVFAVRAIDNAGAKEKVLSEGPNVRRFNIDPALAGPTIFMRSNSAGSWRTGTAKDTRAVFAGQGLRFQWRAVPGPALTPVAGYSYALEDTSNWTPYSPNTKEFPVQTPGDPEVTYSPTEGQHRFFVRAIDQGGFVNVLEARLDVFGGPRKCLPERQILLVVLDTKPDGLIQDSIFPLDYADIERSLADYWFGDFNFQVFQTGTNSTLDAAILNCATSTVWFCSGTDGLLFEKFHKTPPNPLASYVSAGGNLFVVGVSPVGLMRYFELEQGGTQQQTIPLDFTKSVTDTTFLPHWALTHFGIAKILKSINAVPPTVERLAVARAMVPGYPDLPFDPLTWPNGPVVRGLGLYDSDVIPVSALPNPQSYPEAANAEVIYRANTTGGVSLGVRHLEDPLNGGSTVYLGLHPYFIERPAFRQLIKAVLVSFGETPKP